MDMAGALFDAWNSASIQPHPLATTRQYKGVARSLQSNRQQAARNFGGQACSPNTLPNAGSVERIEPRHGRLASIADTCQPERST